MAHKSNITSRPRSEVALGVAIEVRAWLARRQVSANRASQILGWSQPYIAARLNGRQPFDLDDLAQLAELLDVKVMTFFDGPNLSRSGEGMTMLLHTPRAKTSPSGHELTHGRVNVHYCGASPFTCINARSSCRDFDLVA
jgi:hypothetical protein